MTLFAEDAWTQPTTFWGPAPSLGQVCKNHGGQRGRQGEEERRGAGWTALGRSASTLPPAQGQRRAGRPSFIRGAQAQKACFASVTPHPPSHSSPPHPTPGSCPMSLLGSPQPQAPPLPTRNPDSPTPISSRIPRVGETLLWAPTRCSPGCAH